MVKVRGMFAGSNSGLGFHSLFDYVIGPGARQIFLLKGGPGTGKSKFMKDAAAALKKEGISQEQFFCSSDPNSLDAVAFPQLKVALIDATAPHSRQAQLPGCRDQLVCLGNFWSPTGLTSQRGEIEAKFRLRKDFFTVAFRYLQAARILEENVAARNKRLKKGPFGDPELEEIIRDHRNDDSGEGFCRHLFASAITPEGYISHVPGLAADFSQIYVLKGPLGTGKSEYLARLVNCACFHGCNVEVFHSPLDPRKILHVFFLGLDLAVLTADSRENLKEVPGKTLHCQLGLPSWENQEDNELSRGLFLKGVEALQGAREVHQELEKSYAAYMDFEALSRYTQGVLEQILSYKNLS
ncbi:MAG: hypothetical protein GX335_08635 [Firmicutes bacterium]|nr:hypothetical protein [Bacillota bacterium]